MTTRDRPGTSTPCSVGQQLQPGVGAQRDVDPRVGRERIVEHEPLRHAAHGRARREVPVGARLRRARHRRRARRRSRRPADTTTSGENGSTTTGPGGSGFGRPTFGAGRSGATSAARRRLNVRTVSCGTVTRADDRVGAAVGMHRDDRVGVGGAEVRQRDRLVARRERRGQARAVPRGRHRAPGSRAARRRPAAATAARSRCSRRAREHRPTSATTTRIRIGARRRPRGRGLGRGHAVASARRRVRRSRVRRQHHDHDHPAATTSTTRSREGPPPRKRSGDRPRVRGSANAFVQPNAWLRASSCAGRGRVPTAGRRLRTRATCPARSGWSRCTGPPHAARDARPRRCAPRRRGREPPRPIAYGVTPACRRERPRAAGSTRRSRRRRRRRRPATAMRSSCRVSASARRGRPGTIGPVPGGDRLTTAM